MNKRSVFVLLVAIILVLVTVNPSPRHVQAQVPSFFGSTRFPAIDVDGNDHLYLMMSVATAPASEHRPHSQIFFTLSKDGGAHWDNSPETRNLSKSKGEAFGPSVVVTKTGTLRSYVVYQDESSGLNEAYLLRTKKKTKYKKPRILTQGGGGAYSPRVALDSAEAVNIVFGDTTDNVRRVNFIRSTDQGETFSDPLTLSGASDGAFEPELAVDPDDAINVAWEDSAVGAGAIMFARSTDGGQTFSDPLPISTGSGRATQAAIAVDHAGRLSVTWVQEVGSEIQAFYARSTDHGQTFSTPVNMSDKSGALISKPLLVTFADTVYLAYQNEAHNDMQVYLRKSDDAGETFQDAVRISNANNNCGRAHSAAMVVDSQGLLHIVWIDASRVSGCNDEGVLLYSNSKDGRRFSAAQMILAFIL